jgi:tetratricopeptide (TPR) repeat protein
MPRQPRKRTSPKPSERRQTRETWGVLVAQLRIWITPDDAPPSRPFLVMVLDLDNDRVPGQDMLSHTPTPDDVETVLAAAMNHPAPGGGKPRRPAKIVLADVALAEALAPALARVGVVWEVRPLPELDNVVRLLEEHMRGGPEHPGLLSVRGATPEFVGVLFAAAADFYRAAPWVQLNNGQTFALQIPAGSGPKWIASVMGNGGVEYGLGVYKSWSAFEKVFMGSDDPRELFSGHLAVLYGGPHMLPFDDMDALQRYGWEMAGAEAYPAPVVVEAVENMRRPDLTELRWLEAALRAIPLLVRDHLQSDSQGEYQPFEVTLAVATHGGALPVRAVYPGGQLPLEQRPVHSDDWRLFADEDGGEDEAPVIDRRMSEGMMAQLGASLGAEDVIADPRLREAQALMYRAWEESNPAKRLALAHQAIATSPDCADAYVLLAEEEADSLARAAEYYQQGIKASERALGAEYFKDNKGHFWGLLETRPYMRAREGLANTLWSLKRRDEAIEHYRALLELNPDDNQGVRYALLNLLLELDRDAEALALLKQYDDGMAEWLYTWALMEFRQGGGRAADRRLKAALKYNKHAPAYLVGRKRIPNQLPPHYGIGDDAEAVHYAHRYLNHWRRTPGAVEWMKSKL